MKQKLETLIEAYQGHFVEREDEIKGAFLAILANENLLFLGPPGTAKTYLAQNICSSIDDAEFFYYLLTRFTTPEEIFGPLSLKALEEDEFRRKTDGCLPTSHIGFLDEIFKANSSILNSLLTLLNERKFHNGPNVVSTPLLSIFGASNELPEEDENLEALYDRFLFRYEVKPISFEENLRKLIFESPETFLPPKNLSVDEIRAIREQAKDVEFYEDAMDILMAIRRELTKVGDGGTQIYISDRRWKKIVHVLKVAAAAQGHTKVNRSMLLLLEHLLWDHPDQKNAIRRIVIELTMSGGQSYDDLEEKIKGLDPKKYSNKKIHLPVPVTHVSSARNNTTVATLEEVKEVCRRGGNGYNDGRPFRMQNKYYSFDELIEALRIEYGIDSKLEMKDSFVGYLAEVAKLRFEFLALEKFNTKYFDHFKRDLEKNIWTNSRDVDEVVVYHQKELSRIQHLDKEISKLERIKKIEDLQKNEDDQRTNQRNYNVFGY
ncbi:hypothetical protein AZH53_09925 [Methanomicrobiaceae archaeon CYW5]|uniref:AAA family ATPase n=1 Tax=Methanovulcanius yangii TaxID=1789227 RepID=UPI0029CA823C|nr:AAA family ATPase [Methanovulcanius yangii]MBT8508722.1 hypothetical protein [Methanovulcanius yangii]